MQQKELKELNNDGKLISVTAICMGEYYNVTVHTCEESFAVIRASRGGKREFKTLDAVMKMLAEVNIKSFSVR